MKKREFVIYGTPPHGPRQKVDTVYADPKKRTAIKEKLERLKNDHPESSFDVQRL